PPRRRRPARGARRPLAAQEPPHQAEDPAQPGPLHLAELPLPALGRQRQTLAQPPLDPVAAVAEQRLQGVYEAEQVRPLDALTGLQRGRWNAVGRVGQPLAAGELAGGHPPAVVLPAGPAAPPCPPPPADGDGR